MGAVLSLHTTTLPQKPYLSVSILAKVLINGAVLFPYTCSLLVLALGRAMVEHVLIFPDNVNLSLLCLASFMLLVGCSFLFADA